MNHLKGFFKIEEYLQNKKVSIFGAGKQGEYVENWLDKFQIGIEKYIDNNTAIHGKTLNNKVIVSLEEWGRNKSNDAVILICSDWSKEISGQLDKAGITEYLVVTQNHLEGYESEHFKENISEEQFKEIENLLSDDLSKAILRGLVAYRKTKDLSQLILSDYPQYFHPKVSPSLNDAIIDAGAFIGDTAKLFLEKTAYTSKVFSFEPSLENFRRMGSWIRENGFEDKVTIKNMGVFSKTTTLFLETNDLESDSFKVKEFGDERIDVVALDDMFLNQQVDLIKMDIEGSELAALEGAIKTIKKWRPKLQICLYHKANDIYDLIKFVKDNFSELNYEFYIGHHDLSLYETVLYTK